MDSTIEFPNYFESIIDNPEIKEKVENKFETIKEGIVDKKCGWLFFYNRKLILTSQPRLSYYIPKTNQYRVRFIINAREMY